MTNTSAHSPHSSAPPREAVWILGAGHFGKLAVERLTSRLPHADFVVIDEHPDKLEQIRREYGSDRMVLLEEDALSHMAQSELPDDLWIVPAVPRHVAFQWMIRRLNRVGTATVLPVPVEVDHQVPNPFRVPEGTVYSSHATFLCPDACAEPELVCTVTQKPRPTNLYEVLSHIRVDGYRVIVVRSRQLAPGVGGYPVSHLRELFDEVRIRAGSFIIATSCRCHSVINAMTWEPGVSQRASPQNSTATGASR